MISIIIPVYNAAKTLRSSLASIESQSYKDIELLCINDCSSDESLEILNSFSATADFPVKVISHISNKGAAGARNTGIDAASGEYICYLDADDAFSPGALNTIAENLKDQNDILGFDWTLRMESSKRYMRQADYSTPLEALKNMMGGVMRWNLWMFVARRELYTSNGIRFTEGCNMGEDMMVMMKLFAMAGNVKQIHSALYEYNAVNSASISKQFSESNRRQVSSNVDEIEHFICGSSYASDLKEDINHLKLFVKLPLLVSSDKENYKIWYDWWPESNRFASRNKRLPIWTKVQQILASKKCWFGVKIYYIFVYKFVYGVIFK